MRRLFFPEGSFVGEEGLVDGLAKRSGAGSSVLEQCNDDAEIIYVGFVKLENGQQVIENGKPVYVASDMTYPRIKRAIRAKKVLAFVSVDTLRRSGAKVISDPYVAEITMVAKLEGDGGHHKLVFLGEGIDPRRDGVVIEKKMNHAVVVKAVIFSLKRAFMLMFPCDTLDDAKGLRERLEETMGGGKMLLVSGMDVSGIVHDRKANVDVASPSVLVNEYFIFDDEFSDVGEILPKINSWEDVAIWRDLGTGVPFYDREVNELMAFNVGYVKQGRAVFNLVLSGLPSSSKTSCLAQYAYLFGDGGCVVQAQGSTTKGLIPSFKDSVKAGHLASPGFLKCHGKGTGVLMYDGSVKRVEDVVVGDQLMGDDSTSRNVLSLARGRGNMYRVNQENGDVYTVNESHILSLRCGCAKSKTPMGFLKNHVYDVPLIEYLGWSKRGRHYLKGYKVPVRFKSNKVGLDPYFLGLWLGDWNAITSADEEIVDWLWGFVRGCDSVLTGLRQYGLIKNKHIPREFIINSRAVRLGVLAGLVDTDGTVAGGNCVTIVQKSGRLTNDVVFLARSLGFAVSVRKYEGGILSTGFVGEYYSIGISGDTWKIPCRVVRKKCTKRLQCKNVLNIGIDIDSLGEGDYFGFLLDGNHRYLLKDFTVTHNCVDEIFRHVSSQHENKGSGLLTSPIGEYLSKLLPVLTRKRQIFTSGENNDFEVQMTAALMATDNLIEDVRVALANQVEKDPAVLRRFTMVYLGESEWRRVKSATVVPSDDEVSLLIENMWMKQYQYNVKDLRRFFEWFRVRSSDVRIDAKRALEISRRVVCDNIRKSMNYFGGDIEDKLEKVARAIDFTDHVRALVECCAVMREVYAQKIVGLPKGVVVVIDDDYVQAERIFERIIHDCMFLFEGNLKFLVETVGMQHGGGGIKRS